MKTWADLDGWFDFADVFDHELARVPDGGVIVELGCWAGKSTAYMAAQIRDRGRDVRFWAVDWGFGNADKSAGVCSPGLVAAGGNMAGVLASNLRDCGVLDFVYPLTVTGARAALLFPDESLDFVFVDADHRYESVTADLRAWWPKIRPGGAMAGHDYDTHWPEVVRAVDDFFGVPCPHPARETCWGRVKERP